MAKKRCSRLIEVNRLFWGRHNAGRTSSVIGDHDPCSLGGGGQLTMRGVLSDRCRRDWDGRVQSPVAGRQMLPWWRHLSVVGTSWDFSAPLRNSSVLSLELWYVTWVTG